MELKEFIGHATKHPFHPFRIHVDNGVTISVGHPENIVFLPSRAKVREIYVFDTEQDRAWFLGHEAISAIERLPEDGREEGAG